jgi:hypothetical protein
LIFSNPFWTGEDPIPKRSSKVTSRKALALMFVFTNVEKVGLNSCMGRKAFAIEKYVIGPPNDSSLERYF